MAIQGYLSTMSVSDLLQFLAAAKKTGLLKFSHAKVVKGIYFENGIIVGSSTTDPGEFLGQVLIHYGKISETQLQAAMAIQRGVIQGATFDVQSPTSEVQSQAGGVQGSQFSGQSQNIQTQPQARP